MDERPPPADANAHRQRPARDGSNGIAAPRLGWLAATGKTAPAPPRAQVSLEMVIFGNLAEKSLPCAATFKATLSATAL